MPERDESYEKKIDRLWCLEYRRFVVDIFNPWQDQASLTGLWYDFD